MDFSVNLLHAAEKEMKAELTRLMKATKVSSVAGLTQSVLDNKLNKGPLSEYLSKIVKLLDSSMNLCKAAAGSIDEMKTKVLDTQTKLIDGQEKAMSTVKEVVQAETKTWADLFKKNSHQVNQSTQKSVREAIKTVNEEEERSKNLIIYGVKEEEKEDEEWVDDIKIDPIQEQIAMISKLTDCSDIYVRDIRRIGKRTPGKIRPIKVELDSSTDVACFLSKAQKLKTNDEYKMVYLAPDRTAEQRVAHNKLVTRMKEMIRQDSSKHYYIRNDKIQSTDKK